jgi:hypothetical protein
LLLKEQPPYQRVRPTSRDLGALFVQTIPQELIPRFDSEITRMIPVLVYLINRSRQTS